MRPLYISVAAWGIALALLAGAAALDKPPDCETVERPVRATEARQSKEEITEHPFENELIEAALVAQGYFREDVPLSFELQDFLQTACERWGVPYHVALAVIEKESNFQVDAIGPDGHDVGLFQIRRSNHEWLSAETGVDPMTHVGNIECGVWFLAYLYESQYS